MATEPMTIATKLDRMIADLSKVVVAANRVRDFKVGALAQNAIEAIGKLRSRDILSQDDNEWAEWIAWPPQGYPEGEEGHGLMDVCDLQRLKQKRGAAPTSGEQK